MINILYLHGFGSFFNEQAEKIVVLKNNLNCVVFGKDIDYTKTPKEIVDSFYDIFLEREIHLLVGTSMGGWLSAELGARWGVPFVAINPAINPSETLNQYIGQAKDYRGVDYTLLEETVRMYTPMRTDGCGLILLDMADEVIDSIETINNYDKYYDVRTFEGGDHRFRHMEEAIPIIHKFCEQSIVVYK